MYGWLRVMKLMLVQECIKTITARATTGSRKAAAFTEQRSRRFFSVATFLSLQVWLDSITEESEVIITRASFSTKKAFLLHKWI